VFARERNECSANGVALDVAEGGPEVERAQGAGEEAILPEVAAASEAGVKVLGKSAMRPAKGDGQGVVLIRNSNQMNVIRHQAIGQHAEAGGLGVVAEKLFVDFEIAPGVEHALAISSPLGHVGGVHRR
jgi:hypothetical protein